MSIGKIGNDFANAVSSSIDTVTQGLAKAAQGKGPGAIPDAMEVFGAVTTTFENVATQAGAALNLTGPGHLEQPQDFAGKHTEYIGFQDLARILADSDLKVADQVKVVYDKSVNDQGTQVDKSKAKPDSSSTNIDLETQKLQRMVEKRTQLFDMLKQIMEKFDQTAKGVIQNLR